MPTISVVINADNRHGYKNHVSTVGEFGEGSLQGVRSLDFLTESLKNKMNFFRGHDCQCIMYVDQHEEFPDGLFMQIAEIAHSYGNGSRLICKSHNRTKYKWYDYITIEALKWATGDFVVHFDNDSNAIKTDDCDIVDAYIDLLDSGYKYICQPWNGVGDKMTWASTRFFICKRETLDFSAIEQAILQDPLMGKRNPCLEFALAVLVGEENVLYPPREDEKYLIWSWAKYHSGTMKRLNEMNPEDALKRVLELGVHGAQDVLDKPF